MNSKKKSPFKSHLLNKLQAQQKSGSEISLELIDQHLVSMESENAKLKKDVEKLEVILDTTPCTISWIGNDLKYLGVNEALASTANDDKESFFHRPIGFMDENKFFENFAKKLFDSKDKTLTEELISHIKGETKIFWVIGTKYANDKEAVIVGIDITELKKTQEHLVFNERISLIGEMSCGIVHEINNPLNALNLNNNILRKKWEKNQIDAKTVKSHVDKIDDLLAKIQSFISSLKNFYVKSEDNIMETISLNQVLDEAIEITRERARKLKCLFKVDPKLSMKLPLAEHQMVNGNHTQILQVFVNLFTNAFDAVENLPDKYVNIDIDNSSSTSTGTHTTVTITDSGDRPPDEIVDKIFEMFYTTKPKGKGTGLGLGLAKDMLNKIQGDISLDRNSPKTRFAVNLKKP